MQIVDGLKKRDLRALARAISISENDPLKAQELFAEFLQGAGSSFKVGLTGPPGSGKSTLIRGILQRALKDDLRVGVLAVDPSSPFTGGALLADRLRMSVPNIDSNKVFIRSLASRGHIGGLSPGIVTTINLMDYYQFDLLLLETVGVGQVEVEVMYLADLVGVVLVPNLGDEVQAMKSGLMEIADFFIVNKCRLPGAIKIEQELKGMISSSPRFEGALWVPPVFMTDALENEGMDELWSFIKNVRQDENFQAHWQKKKRRQISQQVFLSLVDCFRLKAEEILKPLPLEEYSPQKVRELWHKIILSCKEEEDAEKN